MFLFPQILLIILCNQKPIKAADDAKRKVSSIQNYKPAKSLASTYTSYYYWDDDQGSSFFFAHQSLSIGRSLINKSSESGARRKLKKNLGWNESQSLSAAFIAPPDQTFHNFSALKSAIDVSELHKFWRLADLYAFKTVKCSPVKEVGVSSMHPTVWR